MVVSTMDLGRREERRTRRLQYIHTGISSGLEISIAHGRAPPICLERGRISRPLDKRERQQFAMALLCYVSARQALDGVSTGRHIRPAPYALRST